MIKLSNCGIKPAENVYTPSVSMGGKYLAVHKDQSSMISEMGLPGECTAGLVTAVRGPCPGRHFYLLKKIISTYYKKQPVEDEIQKELPGLL